MTHWLKSLSVAFLIWSINGAFLTQIIEAKPNSDSQPSKIDVPPEIIQDSPVLRRWLQKIPNVWEEIRQEPSFRTRLQLGFVTFPSNNNSSGINFAIEDVFLGQSGLTLSADYQTSFNNQRTAVGTNLHYFLFPLGGYLNLAPLLGYRYIQSNDYYTDGVNVGLRLMLALSRSGAADLSLSQSFMSPGGDREVGITNLTVGYAIAPQLRLSTEIEKQNSRQDRDSRVGINLEWMF